MDYIADVLILGECTDAFASQFRAAGYTAKTCDLKPCEGVSDEHHFQGSWDYFLLEHPSLLSRFRLVIWHPECTKLTVAGNHVYAAGKAKAQERLEAMEYTARRWRILCQFAERAVLENPRGVLKHVLGKFGMTTQPYDWGDDASKTTDWWLHNVPPLVADPALRCPGRMVECENGHNRAVHLIKNADPVHQWSSPKW